MNSDLHNDSAEYTENEEHGNDGQNTERIEQILRGLAMSGILPEGKTETEKQIIEKIRVDYGFPPRPKTEAQRKKYKKAEASGLISPLKGKTAAQKEFILKAQADAGLILPEGRTVSEKALIEKVKLTKVKSPSNFKAKCGLILAAIQSKTQQKQNNMKFLKKMGMPLPTGKSPSETELIQTFIKQQENVSSSSTDEDISPNVIHLYPKFKTRICHKSSSKNTRKTLKHRRKKTNCRTEFAVNVEKKYAQENIDMKTRVAKITEIRATQARIVDNVGVLRNITSKKDSFTDFQGYLFTPSEKRTKVERGKILGQHDFIRCSSPKGRTLSEKALVLKQLQHSPKNNIFNQLGSGNNGGPLNYKAFKTNSFKYTKIKKYSEKEKNIRLLAESGRPLPEAKTESEKDLINNIIFDLGLPPLPKTSFDKLRMNQAFAFNIITPLGEKSRGQKEIILRRLIQAGIPLPRGRSSSEKAMIKRIVNNCTKGRLMSSKNYVKLGENRSMVSQRNVGQGIKATSTLFPFKTTDAELHTTKEKKNGFINKNKQYRDLMKCGMKYSVGKTHAERKNIHNIRLTASPRASLDKRTVENGQAGGLISLSVGQSLEKNNNLIRSFEEADLSLPERRLNSEKQIIQKLTNEKAALTETRLKKLALTGKPLPDGKTASEKILINKVRYESGLPPTPNTRLKKILMSKAYNAGVITPLEGKSYIEKRVILKKYIDADIPLPEGRTLSEKSLISVVKQSFAISPTCERRLKYGLLNSLEKDSITQKGKVIRRLATGIIPEGQTSSEKVIDRKIRDELPQTPLATSIKSKTLKAVHGTIERKPLIEQQKNKPKHVYENSSTNSMFLLPKGKTASDIMKLVVDFRAGALSSENENLFYSKQKVKEGSKCISNSLKGKINEVKLQVPEKDISNEQILVHEIKSTNDIPTAHKRNAVKVTLSDLCLKITPAQHNIMKPIAMTVGTALIDEKCKHRKHIQSNFISDQEFKYAFDEISVDDKSSELVSESSHKEDWSDTIIQDSLSSYASSMNKSFSCQSLDKATFGKCDNYDVYRGQTKNEPRKLHLNPSKSSTSRCSLSNLNENIPNPTILPSDSDWNSSLDSKLIPFDSVIFNSSSASDFCSNDISLRNVLNKSSMNTKFATRTTGTCSSSTTSELLVDGFSPWNKEIRKKYRRNQFTPNVFAYMVVLSDTNIHHRNKNQSLTKQSAANSTNVDGNKITILNGLECNEKIIPTIINSILARKSISEMSSLCVIVPSECDDSSNTSSNDNLLLYDSDSDQEYEDNIRSRSMLPIVASNINLNGKSKIFCPHNRRPQLIASAQDGTCWCANKRAQMLASTCRELDEEECSICDSSAQTFETKEEDSPSCDCEKRRCALARQKTMPGANPCANNGAAPAARCGPTEAACHPNTEPHQQGPTPHKATHTPCQTAPAPYQQGPPLCPTAPVSYQARPPCQAEPVPCQTASASYHQGPAPCPIAPVSYQARPPCQVEPVPCQKAPAPYHQGPAPCQTAPTPYQARPSPHQAAPMPCQIRPALPQASHQPPAASCQPTSGLRRENNRELTLDDIGCTECAKRKLRENCKERPVHPQEAPPEMTLTCASGMASAAPMAKRRRNPVRSSMVAPCGTPTSNINRTTCNKQTAPTCVDPPDPPEDPPCGPEMTPDINCTMCNDKPPPSVQTAPTCVDPPDPPDDPPCEPKIAPDINCTMCNDKPPPSVQTAPTCVDPPDPPEDPPCEPEIAPDINCTRCNFKPPLIVQTAPTCVDPLDPPENPPCEPAMVPEAPTVCQISESEPCATVQECNGPNTDSTPCKDECPLSEEATTNALEAALEMNPACALEVAQVSATPSKADSCASSNRKTRFMDFADSGETVVPVIEPTCPDPGPPPVSATSKKSGIKLTIGGKGIVPSLNAPTFKGKPKIVSCACPNNPLNIKPDAGSKKGAKNCIANQALTQTSLLNEYNVDDFDRKPIATSSEGMKYIVSASNPSCKCTSDDCLQRYAEPSSDCKCSVPANPVNNRSRKDESSPNEQEAPMSALEVTSEMTQSCATGMAPAAPMAPRGSSKRCRSSVTSVVYPCARPAPCPPQKGKPRRKSKDESPSCEEKDPKCECPPEMDPKGLSKRGQTSSTSSKSDSCDTVSSNSDCAKLKDKSPTCEPKASMCPSEKVATKMCPSCGRISSRQGQSPAKPPRTDPCARLTSSTKPTSCAKPNPCSRPTPSPRPRGRSCDAPKERSCPASCPAPPQPPKLRKTSGLYIDTAICNDESPPCDEEEMNVCPPGMNPRGVSNRGHNSTSSSMSDSCGTPASDVDTAICKDESPPCEEEEPKCKCRKEKPQVASKVRNSTMCKDESASSEQECPTCECCPRMALSDSRNAAASMASRRGRVSGRSQRADPCARPTTRPAPTARSTPNTECEKPCETEAPKCAPEGPPKMSRGASSRGRSPRTPKADPCARPAPSACPKGKPRVSPKDRPCSPASSKLARPNSKTRAAGTACGQKAKSRPGSSKTPRGKPKMVSCACPGNPLNSSPASNTSCTP